IADDVNQYAITWGAKDFRDAIASKTKWYLGFEIDPETELTVTCGSTEGMISAMLATVDPGDEVIVFEPFYENYAPDAILSDAKPRYVPLRAPDWSFDRDELRAAFNSKTKAIIICNPNNPTGKVFTHDEMEFIASLCQEFDALCFTDEIYEHILYPREGAEIAHISMAQIEGMRDLILPELERAGFGTFRPDGAYYVMTDISGFGFKDDIEFTRHLIREVGVACVPGSSFYSNPALGSQQVRFCFCKKDETLMLAA